VSALIVGVVAVAVGVAMLLLRDRIEAFWAPLIPKSRPEGYGAWIHVAGPIFVIIWGLALAVSAVVQISN
jgi:hypothetical protein